jgi:DNA-binding beta-propeller fold protein YncE
MKPTIKALIGILILINSLSLFSQKRKQDIIYREDSAQNTINLKKPKQEIIYAEKSKVIQPTLFADLGETCQTPDGMAIDKKGNLFLAITNAISFEKYGSRILTFDENNKPVIWFDKLPLHPVTKKVHPMGIEFGPDGNLYLMDNQFFTRNENFSRLIRVIVKDGKPINAEVLVEGFNFGEAVRWSGERVYITDALFENRRESGIYSFSLEELNKKNIVLNSSNKKDYLIATFTLKPEITKRTIGIDGIAFDKNGNLYAGNFGDGVINKIEFEKDGKVKSNKVVFDSDQLKCCDGFFYDEKRNSIFIANYENNSVHQLNLDTNTISLIWENEDANGSDGQLDNPCETIIYKGKLLVVNYDTFEGEKNKEADSFHTISSFEL